MFRSNSRFSRRYLLGAIGALAALGSVAACSPGTSENQPATPATQRQLWIANAYGDDIHVYEVGSWKLLKHIVVGPDPHGLTATADGRQVLVALELGKGELVWIDTKTGKITHRLELGGRPNAHEMTRDGKWIYVPNRAADFWWVVDGDAKKVVKTIKAGDGPHNTRISADGKRMYLSPQGKKHAVTIVDIAAGHKPIGEIPFSNTLRPSAISADETRFFQNINGLIGFEVADIPSRKMIKRIDHGVVSKFPQDEDSRSHGLEVRPDQKEVWSSYLKGGMVYIHDMTKPDYPELARIQMPGHVYWIRFNPDSKYAYVSVPNIGKVAVVDTQTRKIVTLLQAGDTPKRTVVVDVPLT